MINNVSLTEGTHIRFTYKNWEGKVAVREAIVNGFILGSNEWHPEEQILLNAIDPVKKAVRYFAVKDMSDIKVLGKGSN